MEWHHFDCQCSDFGHIVRFSLDPDDGSVYVEVHLNIWLKWWHRVWIALLYVLGVSKGYDRGHYDVTMLKEEDYHRLHDILDRAAAIQRKERLKNVTGVTQEKPLLKG